MKLTLQVTVEEATIQDLAEGDVVTLRNGAKATIGYIEHIEEYDCYQVEFEGYTSTWFYHNLTAYASQNDDIVHISRTIVIPQEILNDQ